MRAMEQVDKGNVVVEFQQMACLCILQLPWSVAEVMSDLQCKHHCNTCFLAVTHRKAIFTLGKGGNAILTIHRHLGASSRLNSVSE